MSDNEFREKMLELGWDDEYIEECLQSKKLAEKNGVETPLDVFLSPPVIND